MPPLEPLSIGAVSSLTGCKVQTIRYYEEIGLIAPLRRTSGNQRRYGEQAVERLSFVRHARDLGFSLDQIRELLTLADEPEQSCLEADRIARDNLVAVERRIRQLESLGAELRRMVAQCRGGRIADCRILEVLADHGQCLESEHPQDARPNDALGKKRGGGRGRPPANRGA